MTASVIDLPAPEPADEAAFVRSSRDVESPGVAVRHLGVLRPGRLSQAGRIDALVALERAAAWIAARQHRIVAALAADPMHDSLAPQLDREWVKEDVRAALGESAVAVGSRLALADEFVHRLPATLTALEAGAISAAQARYLADAVRCVDDDAVRQVESEVLPDGVDRADTGRFRWQVRRAVAAADPRGAEQRHAEAAEQRRVYVMPQPDAMACVVANRPAEGAQALMTVLQLRAERCAPDDPRSADQRRADALVQLALDALNGYGSCPRCSADGHTERAHSTRPRWQGLRPSVNVTVALSTLLGLDEQPGELDGYGPIPASVAVRIAADEDATWRRLITDELGKLVDYGRTTYRPPAELRDFVIKRDRTCLFPTCNRKACRCEIDHITAWQDGGPTNRDNLVALCCRHHHGKHDAGWRLRRLPDNSIAWTSPTGRTYVAPAPSYPIDLTSKPVVDPRQTEHPPADVDPDPPPPF